MSPKQLIRELESLGTLDDRILEKLREQVSGSAKPVKATSILKYLVKKELISESEAKRLLKSEKRLNEAETRVLSEKELMEANAIEAIEVAAVEESLSAVVDPIDLAPEPAKKKKKKKRKPKSESSLFSDTHTAPASSSKSGTGNDEDGGSKVAWNKRDQKDQWKSKWPVVGAVILILMTICGSLLGWWFLGADAEERYEAAYESLTNLTYADAEEKFRTFVEKYPSHEKTLLAKAYRVQAALRMKHDVKNWTETLGSAQVLLPELMQDEDHELAVIRDDVGLVLAESLSSLSEVAVEKKELPQLKESKQQLADYFEFIDQPIYLTSVARKGGRVSKSLETIDNNRRIISDLINKEERYSTDLRQIREKGQNRKTNEAFVQYIALLRDYPDLAARDELRTTMREVSKVEQDLVIPVDRTVPIATEPGNSIIKNTIALASTLGKPDKGLRGEVVTALVDGAVYGFDLGTGAMRWRKFVGLQTPYQPKAFDLDSVIVSDLLNNEVSRLQLSTGEVIWRAEIGIEFHEPIFNEEQIVVTGKNGEIFLFDGASGEVVGGAKLPQTGPAGGLLSNRLPLFYQVGTYSNLYAISTQDFQCKEVLYLGHAPNQISLPPIGWSGYIVLVRNGEDYADLLVLKPDETGLNLRVIQTINRVTDSTISTPPAYFGRGLILFGDDGDIRVLELNPADEISPVSILANEIYDTKGQRSYIAHKGSNVWTAGQGLLRYRVQRSLGQFKNAEVAEPADIFLSAPQVIEDKLFHIRRRSGSKMTSASLVDSKSLKIIWETNFGGEVVGVQPRDGGLTAVSDQGDVFNINERAVESGVAKKPLIASDVIETLDFDSILEFGDQLVAVSADEKADLLTYQADQQKLRLYKLELDSRDYPRQPPIAVGDQLVVASKRGQISRIDPKSGRKIGTPFLPPVSPGMELPWRPLVALNSDVVVAAHSSVEDTIVTPSVMYFLSLEDPRSVTRVSELPFEQSIVSDLIVDGRIVIGVQRGVDQDSLFQVTAGRQPAIGATRPLEGRYVAGPWQVGQEILVQTDRDELACFSDTFEPKWKFAVGNVQVASAPIRFAGNIIVSLTNGTVMVINPDNGDVRKIDLQQPLAAGPTIDSESASFPGADGTIHQIDIDQLQ